MHVYLLDLSSDSTDCIPMQIYRSNGLGACIAEDKTTLTVSVKITGCKGNFSKCYERAVSFGYAAIIAFFMAVIGYFFGEITLRNCQIMAVELDAIHERTCNNDASKAISDSIELCITKIKQLDDADNKKPKTSDDVVALASTCGCDCACEVLQNTLPPGSWQKGGNFLADTWYDKLDCITCFEFPTTEDAAKVIGFIVALSLCIGVCVDIFYKCSYAEGEACVGFFGNTQERSADKNDHYFNSILGVRVNTCGHFHAQDTCTPVDGACHEYGDVKLIMYEAANGQPVIARDRCCC
jgi:hypothetical protein